MTVQSTCEMTQDLYKAHMLKRCKFLALIVSAPNFRSPAQVFRFDQGRVLRVLRFQPEANLAEPIMNAALVVDKKRTVLAAGMGKQCHLFSLRYKLEEENGEEEDKENSNSNKTEDMPKGETEEERKKVAAAAANGELRKRKREGEKDEVEEKGGDGQSSTDKTATTKNGRNGFLNHRGEIE